MTVRGRIGRLETMKDKGIIPPETAKIVILTAVAVFILTAVTLVAYQHAKSKPSTIVLPGGVTYLGPSSTGEKPKPIEQPQTAPPSPLPIQKNQPFTADAATAWSTYQGKVFPMSFSYPNTLAISAFTGDKHEAVGFAWNNIPAQQNILLNIDRPGDNTSLSEYANKPRSEYVANWWRQYSGLKGARPLMQFTNANNLKGYRVSFVNLSDQTPNVDVFFEVPDRTDMLLHLANGQLDPAVFDRIVDSVAWEKREPSSGQ